MGPIGFAYTCAAPDTEQTVETAWNLGVRSFDTAPHHELGLAEKRLGAVLAQYPRDEYVLSCEVGRRLVPATRTFSLEHGREPGQNLRLVRDFSQDGVLRAIEESLHRLGTDRLDIVYLPDPDEDWERALKQAAPTLAELRDQGTIGAFGVGTSRPAVLSWFVQESSADIVRADSSAVSRLLPIVRRGDLTMVATGVLKSDFPATSDLPAAVCQAHGVTPLEAAIARPLRFPEVAGVLLEMRSAREVTENVRAASARVPEALWKALAEEGTADKG
nr:aldo/keto reductase [Kineosporia rhizophila]